MKPETWQMIDFARFYVMALLRGSPLDLMVQRYPEYEFDVGPDHFVLRKKNAPPAAQASLPAPTIAAAAQPTNPTPPSGTPGAPTTLLKVE